MHGFIHDFTIPHQTQSLSHPQSPPHTPHQQPSSRLREVDLSYNALLPSSPNTDHHHAWLSALASLPSLQVKLCWSWLLCC